MSAQAGSPHAYGDVPHRHPRWIVRVPDELFHLMKWVWGAFIFGGIGVGVVLALAETGLSGLKQWSVVQGIQGNPVASAAVGGALLALLLALTIVGWIAHLRTAAFQQQELLPTVRVSQLRLSDFKLGANPSAAYFERAVFERACEQIRQVARSAGDARDGNGAGGGRQGVMVYGLPLGGKTRLALEALRREAPAFHLLVWPHRAVAPPPWTLEHFRGQRVALLLDDLHEFANQTEAAAVVAAVEKLRKVCRRLVVVGTCRAGTDRDAVERDFAGLLQHLTPLDVEPMARDGAEAEAFKSKMRADGVELHLGSFDGTPGSALLDLERRTTQLRDPAFPRDALAILKALALLRAARVYTYSGAAGPASGGSGVRAGGDARRVGGCSGLSGAAWVGAPGARRRRRRERAGGAFRRLSRSLRGSAVPTAGPAAGRRLSCAKGGVERCSRRRRRIVLAGRCAKRGSAGRQGGAGRAGAGVRPGRAGGARSGT